MIDEMAHGSLRVSGGGLGGPYLMVPVTQLDAVRAVLDRHAVDYWVDSDAISPDNEPPTTVINFGRAGDAARIQAILDEAGRRPGSGPWRFPTRSAPWPIESWVVWIRTGNSTCIHDRPGLRSRGEATSCEHTRGRMTVGEIHAVWKDGRIIPEGPVDWPDGCRLRIEPDPVQPGTADDRAEDWSNAPEAVADWLAWYDSLEPLVFTPEEEADLRDWRRRVKEYTIARMNEGIGSGRE